jgi:phosphoribosylcarboxyaminoimidazole (NCAIR) mutase
LLAAGIVALHDDEVRDRLLAFRATQTESVLAHPDPAD